MLTLGWNDTDGSNETEGWLEGLALGVDEGEADGIELGLTEREGWLEGLALGVVEGCREIEG